MKLILAVLAGVITIVIWLNISGMCWPHFRFLDEDEIINKAIETFSKYSRSHHEFFSSFVDPKDLLDQEDVAEFRRQNQDCCGVAIEEFYDLPPPRTLDLILGRNTGDPVTVQYMADIESTGVKMVKFSVFTSNCGNHLEP